VTGDWAWITGSNTPNAPGVYGTQGQAAAANTPGARSNAVTWTDPDGNLWLFGGMRADPYFSYFNDLWKFVPSTGLWTWISGANTPDSVGNYGSQGTASAGSVPGARGSAVAWTDSAGNLWLFGGAGHDSTGLYGDLNDLWEYAPDTGLWTWVSGSSSADAPGVYGSRGIAAAGNVPPAREGAVAWIDSTGNFWLFGGGFNDLWEFSLK